MKLFTPSLNAGLLTLRKETWKDTRMRLLEALGDYLEVILGVCAVAVLGVAVLVLLKP